ncbi:MAG TPA: histidine kinase [Labilithrix sp.]|jgi:signal transduction histidine kinase
MGLIPTIGDADSRRARRWIGVAVVLLVIALQAGTEIAAGHDRARVLFRVGFTALEMPVIMLALSASFEHATRRRLGSIATLAWGIVIAAALGTAFGLLSWKVSIVFPELRVRQGPVQAPWRSVVFGSLFGVFQFGIWTLAFVYPFAVEDARLRAAEAERLRARADLANLRAHLEPHFILNTLNAIAGLVTEDPREARKLLAALGDLLRDATKDEGEMRALGDEIDWLRRYAAILEARYGGALRFRWDVDPRARGVQLPRLLLQPLVENAVKHGALKRDEHPGSVSVQVRVEGTNLACIVEDDGPGMPETKVRSGAFGIDSVRRRLSLREPRASLVIDSSQAGTRAIVSWPIDPKMLPMNPAEAAE